MYQCALQTYRFSQLFVVFIVTSITCQELYSLSQFLRLRRLCSDDSDFSRKSEEMFTFSKNVAILSQWSKRAIIVPNNLIDSQHYKRHKRVRMTEFHSPSHSILIITQTKVSLLISLNYSKMIPRLVESFRNLHYFIHTRQKRTQRFC